MCVQRLMQLESVSAFTCMFLTQLCPIIRQCWLMDVPAGTVLCVPDEALVSHCPLKPANSCLSFNACPRTLFLMRSFFFLPKKCCIQEMFKSTPTNFPQLFSVYFSLHSILFSSDNCLKCDMLILYYVFFIIFPKRSF